MTGLKAAIEGGAEGDVAAATAAEDAEAADGAGVFAAWAAAFRATAGATGN